MRLKPGAKVVLTLVVLALLGAGAYRMGWLNCIFSLSKDIPKEPCALSHWLGVAAECVSEIAKDPATPDQPWACHCLLAHALAQSTGQSLFNSFHLINHRITLRRERNALCSRASAGRFTYRRETNISAPPKTA